MTKPKPTIDEMAAEHHQLSVDLKFDEAWSIQVQMQYRFGAWKTDKAIKRMNEVAKILGV